MRELHGLLGCLLELFLLRSQPISFLLRQHLLVQLYRVVHLHLDQSLLQVGLHQASILVFHLLLALLRRLLEEVDACLVNRGQLLVVIRSNVDEGLWITFKMFVERLGALGLRARVPTLVQ